MFRTREVSLSPVGAAGEAAAETNFGVGAAKLLAVAIDYTGVPATTDVTISNQGRQLLKRTDSNTDGLFQLAGDMTDSAGAALEKEFAQSPIIYGSLNVKVAQADAAVGGVKLTFFIEE